MCKTPEMAMQIVTFLRMALLLWWDGLHINCNDDDGHVNGGDGDGNDGNYGKGLHRVPKKIVE